MIEPHHRQPGHRPAAARQITRLLPLVLTLAAALAILSVYLSRAAPSSKLRTQEILAASAQQALQHEGQVGPSRTASQQQPQLQRPLDYVQRYAELEGSSYPRECRDRYHGLPYFERVQASWRQPVCAPQAGAALGSSLRCHHQWDQYPEMHCTGANLALDLRVFAAEDALLPQDSHAEQPDAFEAFERPGLDGELLGDCKLAEDSNRWQASLFGKGGQAWLFRSFRSTLGDAQQPQCVAWVEHPVYFLNDKYDSLNLWHGLEDVTHAFEAYTLKGWGAEAQVVVLDAVREQNVLGPTYLPVWRKVFSPQHPPVTLRQLVADASAQAGGELMPGAALCFRDAFFSMHGGISILSRSIRSTTPCANSTFIRAMTRFTIDGLKLTDVHPASRGGSAAAAAPEAQHAQEEEVALAQQMGGRLMLPGQRSDIAAAAAAAAQALASSGAPGKLRVVWALRSSRAERQKEILDLLRRELPKQGVELSAIDLGRLPLEEQIRQARSANVLAGYHGAALTLACFMDPPAALVEVEEEWRCACYTNCARWKGLDYRLIKVPFVPERQLAARVLGEIQAALWAVQQGIGGRSMSGVAAALE